MHFCVLTARGEPVRERGLRGAEEARLELVHPRVGEQQRRVVVRHDRATRHERVPALYPFCSERCRMVDLGKWFNEQYSIDRDLTVEDLPEDMLPPELRG
jgi:endogenous inhibitor of DNA gyrase (YacG/DUF329 family)